MWCDDHVVCCATITCCDDSREGPAWAGLSEAQQRVVDIQLRDFVLGGVGLEGSDRARFNAIEQELAQLSTKFNNNLLDATKVQCTQRIRHSWNGLS